MICPRCQNPLSFTEAACSVCGYSLEGEIYPALFEKACDIPQMWLASGTELSAGCQEIVPCRFANTTKHDLTILQITAHFWKQEPLRRAISKIVRVGEECTLGIPFFAKSPGRYLLTRLCVAARIAGQAHKWQTENEVVLEVLAAGLKKQPLYQINLQDYAQIFGNIETGQGANWQRLRLFPAKIADSKLDYCCLKISSGSIEKYCYLSLREESWLGRSSLVEFQTLVRGYCPDHPENLKLSARQAKLQRKNDHWLIEDTGSRNGTRLNSVDLPTGCSFPVGNGDRITLANSLELIASLYGSSLCLRYEDSNPDVFLLPVEEITMGNSLDCAIYIDGLRRPIAVIPRDNGIALRPLCEFFRNGQKYPAKNAIFLELGDKLRFEGVLIDVAPD